MIQLDHPQGISVLILDDFSSKVDWSVGQSARDYVKSAVHNMEQVLQQDLIPSKLRNQVDRPLPITYRPEVNVSPLLDSALTTRFQNSLGALWWIVELGRIDIMTEVLMLSTRNAMPREGHLKGFIIFFIPQGP